MLTASDLVARAKALNMDNGVTVTPAFYQACAIDRIADSLNGLSLNYQRELRGDAGSTLREKELGLAQGEVDSFRGVLTSMAEVLAQMTVSLTTQEAQAGGYAELTKQQTEWYRKAAAGLPNLTAAP